MTDSNILQIESLIRSIKEGCNAIRQNEREETVILIGNVSSGKTTLMAYLSSSYDIHSLREKQGEKQNNQISENQGQGLLGLDQNYSQLTIPKMDGKQFWDCPEFTDTTGVDQSIINQFFMKKIFERSKEVKCISVIDSKVLEEVERGEKPLQYLIRELSQFQAIANINLENRLLVVFSNVNDDEQVDHYKQRLYKLLKIGNNTTKEQEILLKSDILLFPRLKDNYDYSTISSHYKEQIFESLKRMKSMKRKLQFQITENQRSRILEITFYSQKLISQTISEIIRIFQPSIANMEDKKLKEYFEQIQQLQKKYPLSTFLTFELLQEICQKLVYPHLSIDQEIEITRLLKSIEILYNEIVSGLLNPTPAESKRVNLYLMFTQIKYITQMHIQKRNPNEKNEIENNKNEKAQNPLPLDSSSVKQTSTSQQIQLKPQVDSSTASTRHTSMSDTIQKSDPKEPSFKEYTKTTQDKPKILVTINLKPNGQTDVEKITSKCQNESERQLLKQQNTQSTIKGAYGRALDHQRVEIIQKINDNKLMKIHNVNQLLEKLFNSSTLANGQPNISGMQNEQKNPPIEQIRRMSPLAQQELFSQVFQSLSPSQQVRLFFDSPEKAGVGKAETNDSTTSTNCLEEDIIQLQFARCMYSDSNFSKAIIISESIKNIQCDDFNFAQVLSIEDTSSPLTIHVCVVALVIFYNQMLSLVKKNDNTRKIFPKPENLPAIAFLNLDGFDSPINYEILSAYPTLYYASIFSELPNQQSFYDYLKQRPAKQDTANDSNNQNMNSKSPNSENSSDPTKNLQNTDSIQFKMRNGQNNRAHIHKPFILLSDKDLDDYLTMKGKSEKYHEKRDNLQEQKIRDEEKLAIFEEYLSQILSQNENSFSVLIVSSTCTLSPSNNATNNRFAISDKALLGVLERTAKKFLFKLIFVPRLISNETLSTPKAQELSEHLKNLFNLSETGYFKQAQTEPQEDIQPPPSTEISQNNLANNNTKPSKSSKANKGKKKQDKNNNTNTNLTNDTGGVSGSLDSSAPINQIQQIPVNEAYYRSLVEQDIYFRNIEDEIRKLFSVDRVININPAETDSPQGLDGISSSEGKQSTVKITLVDPQYLMNMICGFYQFYIPWKDTNIASGLTNDVKNEFSAWVQSAINPKTFNSGQVSWKFHWSIRLQQKYYQLFFSQNLYDQVPGSTNNKNKLFKKRGQTKILLKQAKETIKQLKFNQELLPVESENSTYEFATSSSQSFKGQHNQQQIAQILLQKGYNQQQQQKLHQKQLQQQSQSQHQIIVNPQLLEQRDRVTPISRGNQSDIEFEQEMVADLKMCSTFVIFARKAVTEIERKNNEKVFNIYFDEKQLGNSSTLKSQGSTPVIKYDQIMFGEQLCFLTMYSQYYVDYEDNIVYLFNIWSKSYDSETQRFRWSVGNFYAEITHQINSNVSTYTQSNPSQTSTKKIMQICIMPQWTLNRQIQECMQYVSTREINLFYTNFSMTKAEKGYKNYLLFFGGSVAMLDHTASHASKQVRVLDRSISLYALNTSETNGQILEISLFLPNKGLLESLTDSSIASINYLNEEQRRKTSVFIFGGCLNSQDYGEIYPQNLILYSDITDSLDFIDHLNSQNPQNVNKNNRESERNNNSLHSNRDFKSNTWNSQSSASKILRNRQFHEIYFQRAFLPEDSLREIENRLQDIRIELKYFDSRRYNSISQLLIEAGEWSLILGQNYSAFEFFTEANKSINSKDYMQLAQIQYRFASYQRAINQHALADEYLRRGNEYLEKWTLQVPEILQQESIAFSRNEKLVLPDPRIPQSKLMQIDKNKLLEFDPILGLKMRRAIVIDKSQILLIGGGMNEWPNSEQLNTKHTAFIFNAQIFFELKYSKSRRSNLIDQLKKSLVYRVDLGQDILPELLSASKNQNLLVKSELQTEEQDSSQLPPFVFIKILEQSITQADKQIYSKQKHRIVPLNVQEERFVDFFDFSWYESTYEPPSPKAQDIQLPRSHSAHGVQSYNGTSEIVIKEQLHQEKDGSQNSSDANARREQSGSDAPIEQVNQNSQSANQSNPSAAVDESRPIKVNFSESADVEIDPIKRKTPADVTLPTGSIQKNSNPNHEKGSQNTAEGPKAAQQRPNLIVSLKALFPNTNTMTRMELLHEIQLLDPKYLIQNEIEAVDSVLTLKEEADKNVLDSKQQAYEISSIVVHPEQTFLFCGFTSLILTLKSPPSMKHRRELFYQQIVFEEPASHENKITQTVPSSEIIEFQEKSSTNSLPLAEYAPTVYCVRYPSNQNRAIFVQDFIRFPLQIQIASYKESKRSFSQVNQHVLSSPALHKILRDDKFPFFWQKGSNRIIFYDQMLHRCVQIPISIEVKNPRFEGEFEIPDFDTIKDILYSDEEEHLYLIYENKMQFNYTKVLLRCPISFERLRQSPQLRSNPLQFSSIVYQFSPNLSDPSKKYNTQIAFAVTPRPHGNVYLMVSRIPKSNGVSANLSDESLISEKAGIVAAETKPKISGKDRTSSLKFKANKYFNILPNEIKMAISESVPPSSLKLKNNNYISHILIFAVIPLFKGYIQDLLKEEISKINYFDLNDLNKYYQDFLKSPANLNQTGLDENVKEEEEEDDSPNTRLKKKSTSNCLLTNIEFCHYNQNDDKENQVRESANILILVLGYPQIALPLRESLKCLTLKNCISPTFEYIKSLISLNYSLKYLDISDCQINSLDQLKAMGKFIDSQQKSLVSLNISRQKNLILLLFFNKFHDLTQSMVEKKQREVKSELTPVADRFIELEYIDIGSISLESSEILKKIFESILIQAPKIQGINIYKITQGVQSKSNLGYLPLNFLNKLSACKFMRSSSAANLLADESLSRLHVYTESFALTSLYIIVDPVLAKLEAQFSQYQLTPIKEEQRCYQSLQLIVQKNSSYVMKQKKDLNSNAEDEEIIGKKSDSSNVVVLRNKGEFQNPLLFVCEKKLYVFEKKNSIVDVQGKFPLKFYGIPEPKESISCVEMKESGAIELQFREQFFESVEILAINSMKVQSVTHLSLLGLAVLKSVGNNANLPNKRSQQSSSSSQPLSILVKISFPIPSGLVVYSNLVEIQQCSQKIVVPPEEFIAKAFIPIRHSRSVSDAAIAIENARAQDGISLLEANQSLNLS